MKPLKLRTPIITFERIRISLFLVIYALLAEYVDPRPFMSSTLAKFLYVVLVVEIIRQVIAARMETSWGAAVQVRTWKERWDQLRKRVPSFARYRVRRVLTIIAGLWAIGFMLDALTTRCDGAIQCVLLAPRMAIENLPQALQVAIYIAIGMLQLIIMVWSLTKVGFVKVLMPGSIDVSWDDIYGQDAPRDKVRRQVELLEESAEVEAAGGYMPRGVLLFGPPGTGKTFLAKAAAAASTKPLILVPPGGFASTFVGINFLKVHSLFRLMRKLGRRHGGVICFIDEIDSLGSRGHEIADQTAPVGCVPSGTVPAGGVEPTSYIDGSGGNQGTLQAFLAALDGMDEPRGLVNKLMALLGLKPLPSPPVKWLVIGATNRQQALDPALTRAGRLSLKVNVPYPTKAGLIQTYKGYLATVRTSLTLGEIEWAARQHYRGTGAEVKDAVNEALLLTFADDRADKGVITKADLMKALTRVKFGEPVEPFETQEGLRMVAIHEAGHAVALYHTLRHRQHIWFATVERFGGTGGMVARTPNTDDWVESRTDVEAGVVVSLASRVAEMLIFGEQTNGHGGDGANASSQAALMVRYGHTFDPKTGTGRLLYHDSDDEFHLSVEQVLKGAFKRAWDLLEPRQEQIRAVAQMLEERGTVPGDEIHALLERMEPDIHAPVEGMKL